MTFADICDYLKLVASAMQAVNGKTDARTDINSAASYQLQELLQEQIQEVRAKSRDRSAATRA